MSFKRFVGLTVLLVVGAILTTTLAAFGASIDFWIYEPSGPAGEALEQLRADFEALSPGNTVNIIPIPKGDFNTKLNTAIAVGEVPDASYLDQPLVAQFVEDGLLDPVPEGRIDESIFYQGALNTNRVEGILYGLPLTQTCTAIYYNKDLVPDIPETWDELIQVAEEVYDPDKQIAAFGFSWGHYGGGWGAWLWHSFVAASGGQLLDEENQVVSFAEQPVIDALQLWVDLLAYSPFEVIESENSFQTGHVAMMISGPWEIGGLRESWPDLNWGVALIPRKAEADFGTNIGGDNGVVYAASENKGLAWAWLKFLTLAEPNVVLSRDVMGNFPINLTVAKGDWLAGDEALGAFMEQMKYAQTRPRVKEWLKINDEILGAALSEALGGEKTPTEALNDAAEKVKQLLGW